jgi:hypothetical protein
MQGRKFLADLHICPLKFGDTDNGVYCSPKKYQGEKLPTTPESLKETCLRRVLSKESGL